MMIAYFNLWDLHTLVYLLMGELLNPPKQLLYRIEQEVNLVDNEPMFLQVKVDGVHPDKQPWKFWTAICEEARMATNTMIALELTDEEYDLISQLVLEICSFQEDRKPYPREHSYARLFVAVMEAGRHSEKLDVDLQKDDSL